MKSLRRPARFRSGIAGLLGLASLPVGVALATDANLNGPDYTPPFQVISGDRLEPEIVVKNFGSVAMPSFQCGNKRVTIRERDGKLKADGDNQFGITINDQEVCRILFRSELKKDGSYRSSDPAPFGKGPENAEKPTLAVDQEARTITFSKRYLLPDGEEATFQYRLQPDGPGKLLLTWDLGISEDEYAKFSQDKDNVFWLGWSLLFVDGYRRDGIAFNGENPRPLVPSDSLPEKGTSETLDAITSIQYNPLNPLEGFTLEIPESKILLKESLQKYQRGNQHSLYARSTPTTKRPQGSLVIDLLQSAVANREIPPPVESFDFWDEDAIHYPTQPTRNLLPNSGFEQGLRYWKWGTGGAKYTPSDIPRFEVVDGGLFGSHMLAIHPVQTGSQVMSSFSLPSRKGEFYTISYYAKAAEGGEIRFQPFSTQQNGKFTRTLFGQAPTDKLTPDWKRYSFTIEGDGRMYALWLKVRSRGTVFIDGVQVEKGQEATPFAAPPLEGYLTTSDPTNNVESGHSVDAVLEISGAPETKGTAEITLRDFYRKVQSQITVPVAGGDSIQLPFDEPTLGTGVYSVQVRYTVPGTTPYDDYYRFSVLDSLDGTHKTKVLFGQLFSARTSRSDDFQALLKRYGFGGATTYGPGKASDPEGYKLREKYGITDYLHIMSASDFLMPVEERRKRLESPEFRLWASLRRTWLRPEEKEQVTLLEHYDEETLQKIEESAERVARENPDVRAWAFGTEEETTIPAVKERNFTEFAKLLEAFHRGIKRGNPEAMALPSGGTSGYSSWRGADIINGYLDSTKDTVKWDAVAVHPYGAADGTDGNDDLDEVLRLLRDNMAQRGYGKETPILLTEGGIGTTNTTFKGGNAYDYTGGHVSYDFGLREYVNSSLVARSFLICLKYWPQLETYNFWWSPNYVWMDQELALNATMNAINTLGHLFPNPTFVADIRPAPGMRGYAFRDESGQGTAAIWATLDAVDQGIARGPVMRVKFSGELPELIDLMGRKWPLTPGDDGQVEIQLTSAPLFLRGENPETLAADLAHAEVVGAGATLKVSFEPQEDGKIGASAQNLLSRDQKAELSVDGQRVAIDLPQLQKSTFPLEPDAEAAFGKMFHWNKVFTVEQSGKNPLRREWNMDYFFVPRVDGEPDWDAIPSIPFTHLHRPAMNGERTPGGHEGDQSAHYQIAWNEENLYLRVEAEDDHFDVANPEFWNSEQARKNELYILDGSLELYLDGAANGRLGNGGFDLDDYRYDFSTSNPEGRSGPGLVNRLREPFMEYALGIEMPSKEEAASKIRCEFTRISDTRFAYTITLAQRYLEPFRLEKGNVAGFALYVQDRMDDGTLGTKGLSLATTPDASPDMRPQIWPLMILVGAEEFPVTPAP